VSVWVSALVSAPEMLFEQLGTDARWRPECDDVMAVSRGNEVTRWNRTNGPDDYNSIRLFIG
jgi:hypothetical protein